MIYLMVHPAAMGTMRNFIKYWRPAGAPELTVITYEAAPARSDFLPGTFIFADLERLSDAEKKEAALFRERVINQGIVSFTLNDPLRTLTRKSLLELLQTKGINNFRIHPITASPEDVRLPAFFRDAQSHKGPLTGLIENERDLREEAARIREAAERIGTELDDLLIVEYVDTRSPDGVFRKYSTFIVGDRTVARHLLFSRDWMVKVETVGRNRDLGSREYAAEELEYVRGNPHDSWIRDVAGMAGIEYGRIDYGMGAGRPQIWEINLNPTVCSKPSLYKRRNKPSQRLFAQRFSEALTSIDSKRGGG